MASATLKFWTLVALWSAVIYLNAGLFHGGYDHHHHQPNHDYFHVHLVQVNHTIKCAAKGGSCLFVDQCDVTTNIYKLGLCGYNYSVVCCISRETVCNRNWGFCINTTDNCRASGNYYSWFSCNSTHRCCRPYVKKLRVKEEYQQKGHRSYGQGNGQGHHGHAGHNGGYSYGHQGHSHVHQGYGGGYQGNYARGHGGNHN